MKLFFLFLIFLLSPFVLSAQSICQPNTYSLEFDGFSAYVDVPNGSALAANSTLTVEAWINPASFGATSAQNSIFCKHGWSFGEGGYVLRCGGNGVVSFNIAGLDAGGNPTSWIEVASQANVIPLNSWTHVAGTFNGDTLNLYVNGLLSAQTPFQGSITGSSLYSPKIGRLSDSFGGRYFSGLIDEVRVWNRDLSAAEINDRMNRHLNPAAETGLVGYWRFNDGPGATTTTDFSFSAGNAAVAGASFLTSVPFSGSLFTASVSALGEDTICANETATFMASPNGQGYSFIWSNGFTDSLAVTNVPGSYYAIITDGNGCSDTSNVIELVVNPLPPAAIISQNGNDLVASNVTGLYQWYKDGAPFADDFTVSNAASGSYVLLVEDSLTGCTSSSNVFTITTGLPEWSTSLQIFPNPAKDFVLVRQGLSPESSIWQLFDLSGRLLQSGILPPVSQAAINLQSQEPGLYMLSLQSDSGSFCIRILKE